MTTPLYDLPRAIRIGAKLRGQTRNGDFFEDGCSCAIGAALEAEGMQDRVGVAPTLWPELGFYIGPDQTLWEAIVLLNDNAGWTREEIADWLDYILP